MSKARAETTRLRQSSRPAREERPDSTILSRIVERQIARPLSFLAFAMLTMLITGAIATRLRVMTGFEALLPDSCPSVLELNRVAGKTGGGSTLFVVIEGNDEVALRRAADALVPALTGLGQPWVTQAEDGVHDVVTFLEPRAGLYAKLDDLEGLRDDVEARVQYEVGEQMGTNLALDAASIPKPITEDLVKRRFGADKSDEDRFPGGYYQSKDGHTLVVTLRSAVLSNDFAKGPEVIAKVGDVVSRVDPRSFDPSARWGITGDLAIGIREYQAINRDLTEVGIAGAIMIASVILLYYLRARMLFALCATIAIGLAWTFGFTELALGHLNIATGFLFTIVAGNGINFGILFMARYLEERRQHSSIADAIESAQRETWRPTLTAALAASASYGSLLMSDFRGFREFGIIGCVGMVLCWIATYAFLPSILALIEPLWPETSNAKGLVGRLQRATREGIAFGRPFAFLVARAPRLVTACAVVLALAGSVVAVRYVRTDPMEYDLSRVQSDRRIGAEEQRLVRIAKQITGYVGLDGMAILVDRTEQIEPLEAALDARRDAAPADRKPFLAVHALQDFVPKEQAQKLVVLAQLKKRLVKARKRNLIDDADWSRIERFIPPDDLAPFGIADLPEGLARSFTERDGTRGRILYISPTSDALLDDSHYLFRWADSFRRTELPDGSVVLGSGRAVIYADMWAAIIHDIPWAVAASFGATVLLVLVAFRARSASFAVLLALLVGIAWAAGALSLLSVKLNFLNFIALPITFGIGVDYAVNIVGRDITVRDSVEVVRRTGGAVVLCSLTTLLGYLALVRSANFAVRSLGVAAVVGEIACLLAAVLFLPAALRWWRSRKAVRALHPEPVGPSSS